MSKYPSLFFFSQWQRKIPAFCLIALAMFVVGCDGKIDKSKSSIETNIIIEKVRLGVTHAPPSWLMLIAHKKQFYKKNGLDVTLTTFKSGKRALKGMLSGKVDVATTAEGPIIFQNFKRKDFSIFATIGKSSNDNVIVAARDRGINKAADIKGKRISTQSKSSAHFYMHLFLLENGIAENSMIKSFMKIEDLPQELKQNKTDVISTREPFLSEAVKLLGDNAIVFETPGLYLKSFELVAFNTYIKKNKSILTKILKATLDAENFLNENKLEAVDLLSKTLSISKESVINSLLSLDLSVSLDQLLILNLEDEARWVINNKFYNEYRMPNFLEYIVVEPLKTVKPEVVTIN